jgi:hypothetical protein
VFPVRYEVNLFVIQYKVDPLCGLVFRVLDYKFGGSGSIPVTTKNKVVGLERGPLKPREYN